MPRANRLHVPQSIYYVRHVSRPEQPIFITPQDRVEFETILASVLKRYEVDVYAFVWEKHSIRFACCVREWPLSQVMRTLMSRYRRAMLRTRSSHEAIFSHRHGAVVVDPQFLPHVTRHIHRCAPASEEFSPDSGLWWSSYPAYLGAVSVHWLNTRHVLRKFSTHIKRAREKYRAFVEQPFDSVEADTFEHAADHGQPIRPARKLTLQDIINDALASQGTTWEGTISRSREHQHVRTRALIAWHAVAHKVATRSAVARMMNTTESALRQAIARHRTARPDLFVVGALRRSGPLLRLPRSH